ncbi:uncharacterized protein LOC120130673 [Hibiscus syriacus]|uniref:uncharacterized protein LOC120130673 n=1 Tax=Hibiscus syriacus TaxID=106335 RepID=UPI001924050C|nr:uncharacterized protein LOC120130673 [Hibiscus syriacus]
MSWRFIGFWGFPRTWRQRLQIPTLHAALQAVILQALKHVQRCLEGQRRYLCTALERACKKIADQYLGDGTTGNTVLYEAASASLGNFTNIRAGPSGFRRSVTTMSPFCFNQQNAYPKYNTPTSPANIDLRQPPFGYQRQASLHAAPQGNFSTSPGYSVSSSYQKTSPAVASNVDVSDDEDPIRALLNWTDVEPKNLDTAF